MPNEVTIPPDFQHIFFLLFVKIRNKAGLNKAGMDLMLLQGELRPEWKRQCLEPGWSGDQA